MSDAIQLAQDAHLHFFCRLVCKGNSQDRTVGVGIFNDTLHVLRGQCEGFSAARTCFIHRERWLLV